MIISPAQEKELLWQHKYLTSPLTVIATELSSQQLHSVPVSIAVDHMHKTERTGTIIYLRIFAIELKYCIIGD